VVRVFYTIFIGLRSKMASIEQIFAAMAVALPSSNFPKKIIAMEVDGSCYCVDGIETTVSSIQSLQEVSSADLYVTTSLKVLQDLLQKRLNPQQAFMKGLLKMKGNMGLAMKLTVLVNATRNQLYPESKL
jgi:putative sterol carrier protein